MVSVQCDKNLKKVLERFFYVVGTKAEVYSYSEKKSDICILRNYDDFNDDYIPAAEYILINSDDKKLIKHVKGLKSKIITCGLSTRSTATLSSISDSKYVMCLQRSINSLSGKKLPPFEFPFEIKDTFFDDVSIIIIITAALLCDADVSQLNKISL